MVGVLFIVIVPQKEFENELRLKDNTTNIVMEKEKYEKASKVINELKNNKRFGSMKNSIESYATSDDCSIITSKCKSTDLSHENEKEGIYKSKSETSLNEVLHEGGLKSSWEDMKQVMKPRKHKLNITKPARGTDVLGTFQWDTPLETILMEILTQLNICSVSWTPTRDNHFWKVTFCLKSGNLCEELLQVLRTLGVGCRAQSSISVLPCTLFYQSNGETNDNIRNENIWQRKISSWSQFSSSVRARNHLPQILHAVQADASLTFDWLFLLVVAAFVSAIGLVEDSTVILVASMLISPLMGPITAGTLGTAVRDRSLQRMGVMHELLGLFLSLVIGFIFGLCICAVDERYGVGDWPTYEMISRCEIRSLWVGVLIAIPSGAGVALAVLGEYTASLVGVAISASLLPPAVNAGLLWSMSLVHLIYADDETRWSSVVTTARYSEDAATELALLGTVSLCLTLVNIVCIFLAGVAVYKVKEVCPLDKRDIPWWRTNLKHISSSKSDREESTWNIYNKLNEDLVNSKPDAAPEKITQIQSDTITYRRPHPFQKSKDAIEDYYSLGVRDTESSHATESRAYEESENQNDNIKYDAETNSLQSNIDSIEENTKKLNHNYDYYNFGFEDREDIVRNTKIGHYFPTIEPSSNLTVDAKKLGIVLGNKSFHV